jgi:hypothetical protein
MLRCSPSLIFYPQVIHGLRHTAIPYPSATIKDDTKMKKGKASIKSSDIERGGDVHSETTSDGMKSLWDFVPCVIEQDDGTVSSSEVNKNEPESIPNIPLPPPPPPVQVVQSESFFDDSKPPPMTIAVSTSETDEDDEEIINISKDQLHTDPFAPREGRTLCWRNINMTLVRFMTYCSTISDFFFQLLIY